MIYVLVIIVSLVLFIRVSDLSSRVSFLEKKLKESPVPSATSVSNIVTTPESFSHAVSTPAQSEPNPIIEWFKENWVSKLGVILILIGFGWFISYAFVHNWIGPIGRIALGFSVGALLCLIGAWRISKDNVQANILIILGSAIVLITGYAARTVYNYFDPVTILALSALVSAYITTLAVKYNKENLAIYGVIVASVAPLLTHAPEPSLVGLFLYLGIVSIASVWVAVWRGWGSVNLTALLGVLLYTFPFVFGLQNIAEDEKIVVIFITSILSLLYFVVNIFSIVKAKESVERHSVYIAVANSILIFTVINELVIEELRSLLFAGWMIIFAAGSLYVSAHVKKQTFFYIYGLVAVVFLGVATAIELSGPVLTIAFILEAAIISLLTYIMTNNLVSSARMSLLMVLPAIISVDSLLSSVWSFGIFHEEALVIVLMSITLFIIGIFLMKHYKESVHEDIVRNIYVVLNSGGVFYLFCYIWLSSHFLWSENVATIFSLASYTIMGIFVYIKGLVNGSKVLKKIGEVILFLVILRLVIVDVWQMPLAPRIVIFILIGILLVSTAFIGRKQKSLNVKS